jgi:hypothetical protein
MNQLHLIAGETVRLHAEWTSRWHESSTTLRTDPP